VGDQPHFHGNLGGVQGSYEYQAWNGLYAGARVLWRQGTTESSIADRKLTYVDAQERLGYTYFSDCQKWKFTLFSGFGYRYLWHKLSQDEQQQMRFEYNEFYVPVGILSNYYLCCWVDIGLNCIWMPQVYPTVEIKPLRGARWILKNTVKNVLVEVPFTFYPFPNNCYALIVKPFYEHWEDGRSTAKTLGGEPLGLPKNLYNFWGFEVNLAFTF
jgi:hypothetical protein